MQDRCGVKTASLRDSCRVGWHAFAKADRTERGVFWTTTRMDFWFAAKKTIAVFLNPVSITLELILLGFFLLVLARWIPRRSRLQPGKGRRLIARRRFLRRSGEFCILLGALLLYLSSIDPVAKSLTLYLERQCAAPIGEDGMMKISIEPEFIVVLAGGQRSLPEKPVLSRLSHPCFSRVAHAVEFWKKSPSATFVVTGHPAETEAMSSVAEQLGVSPESILKEQKSRDTKDHPRFLKPILGNSPFLLVTSATHMPRSAGLFRREGLDPTLAAVDYIVWPGGGNFHLYQPRHLTPRVINVNFTAMALHEILGMRWARLRGQLAE